VRTNQIKSAQAITSGNGILVSQRADGATYTTQRSRSGVSFRCVKTGERPA